MFFPLIGTAVSSEKSNKPSLIQYSIFFINYFKQTMDIIDFYFGIQSNFIFEKCFVEKIPDTVTGRRQH